MKNCGLLRSLALTVCLLLTPIAGLCSPGPNSQGAPVFAPTSYFDPGDNACAIGRTYTVFKTNESLTFVNRSTGVSTPVSDASFWNVIGNFGGTSITPRGDGRVLCDPYSPCGDNQGHWMAVELGTVNNAESASGEIGGG